MPFRQRNKDFSKAMKVRTRKASTRKSYLFRKEGSTQRADFTLTATPLAACIRQSNYYIPLFPVSAPQSLQHLFWDQWVCRAATFCCHPSQIRSLLFPCVGISRTLLIGRMMDVIYGPRIKCVSFKKSPYNERKRLLMSQVDQTRCTCIEIDLPESSTLLLQREPPQVKMTARINSLPHSFTP